MKRCIFFGADQTTVAGVARYAIQGEGWLRSLGMGHDRLHECVLDWKGILKTTDDLVVFPFDPHNELDRAADWKASVPEAKLRLLRDRGYWGRKKARRRS